jgi:hypothetical protein
MLAPSDNDGLSLLPVLKFVVLKEASLPNDDSTPYSPVKEVSKDLQM